MKLGIVVNELFRYKFLYLYKVQKNLKFQGLEGFLKRIKVDISL